MNHPNATPAEVAEARENIYRASIRAGHDADTADEMAQVGMDRILFRVHRKRCPASILRAAAWEIAAARRHGWHTLLPAYRRPRKKHRIAAEQAAEMATMAIYRRRAGNLTPAQLAEQAEAWGSSHRAAAIRTAVAHSLIDAVMAAQGIGPTACVHEVGHSPSLYGVGQPKRPPCRGVRGLHTDTDPVPGSHARAAEECRRHAAAVAAG